MRYDNITSLHGFQTKKRGVFDFFLVTFVDFSLISRRSKKRKKKEGGVRQTDKTDRNVEAKMRQIRLQDFAKMIDHPHVYLQ